MTPRANILAPESKDETKHDPARAIAISGLPPHFQQMAGSLIDQGRVSELTVSEASGTIWQD